MVQTVRATNDNINAEKMQYQVDITTRKTASTPRKMVCGKSANI